jgi:hypothetical protein
MTEPIDPKLMEEEAARIDPLLRRLSELRRDGKDPDLSPEEQAMLALIEASSPPPEQEQPS